eukprot:c18196_g1_i1 orf=31-441(+)
MPLYLCSAGVTFPAGWTIWMSFTDVHLNPEVYQDPLKFNPWRWQDKVANPCWFTPFGGGIRLCPGAEVAKMHISMFLHLLVTRCRWKTAEPDNVTTSSHEITEKGFSIFMEHNASMVNALQKKYSQYIEARVREIT